MNISEPVRKIFSRVGLILICLIQLSSPCGADGGVGDADRTKILEKCEIALFSRTFHKEHLEERLKRLELAVFGHSSSGTIQQRLTAISGALLKFRVYPNAETQKEIPSLGASDSTCDPYEGKGEKGVFYWDGVPVGKPKEAVTDSPATKSDAKRFWKFGIKEKDNVVDWGTKPVATRSGCFLKLSTKIESEQYPGYYGSYRGHKLKYKAILKVSENDGYRYYNSVTIQFVDADGFPLERFNINNFKPIPGSTSLYQSLGSMQFDLKAYGKIKDFIAQ